VGEELPEPEQVEQPSQQSPQLPQQSTQSPQPTQQLPQQPPQQSVTQIIVNFRLELFTKINVDCLTADKYHDQLKALVVNLSKVRQLENANIMVNQPNSLTTITQHLTKFELF
jgi:hypothetical protein